MISILIPTRNGEQYLPELLRMLQAQVCEIPFDIHVIDSSSEDQTRKIVRNAGVHLQNIAADTFDHGGTRSMAARQVEGDIVVFLTQDAIPADEYALARLVAPLLEDNTIAASYGRQLANRDANPFSEHLRLFNYPDKGNVRCWQDRHTHGFKTIFISNSFAAYRKQCLADVGFFPDKFLFGEDTYTVARLMERGYCVAYVADARVYHSHNYSMVEDFRRYFDIGVFHVRQPELLAKFGTPTGAGKRYVFSEISFLLQRRRYMLLPQSCLRNLLKFTAYALGKRYSFFPCFIVKSMSMHSRWWG